jgi:hypothetical protein
MLCSLIYRIICIVFLRPVYPDIVNLVRCLVKVSRDQETCSVLASPNVWCRKEDYITGLSFQMLFLESVINDIRLIKSLIASLLDVTSPNI